MNEKLSWHWGPLFPFIYRAWGQSYKEASIKKLILLLFFLTVYIAHAGVYSWTDADGIRHFSDTPPPDTYAQDAQEQEEQEEVTSSPKTTEQKQFEANEKKQQSIQKRVTVKQDYQNANDKAKKNRERERAERSKKYLQNRIALEEKDLRKRYEDRTKSCCGDGSADCDIHAREWYRERIDLLRADPKVYFYRY